MGCFDFLNMKPQLSAGWADTRKKKIIFISDRRLKRDIALLATLKNGMKIYSFRYNWSDTVHVGVMAQDLLIHREWRRALCRMANGFYAVDYAVIGLRMATIDEWRSRGVDTIVAMNDRSQLTASNAA